MSTQYLFPFITDTSYSEDDFIPSPESEVAYHFIKQWPDWGTQRFATILILYGETGCGKTHLAHLFKNHSGALFITANQLHYLPATASIIEDIDHGNYPEEGLLHYLNNAVETHHYVLMTCSCPPSQLKIQLPDLQSRIKSFPSLAIASPGDDLLRAVLMKQLTDRQLRLSSDAITYLLSRAQRSFTAIRDMAALLDNKALMEKRNITIPFIKEVLAESIT